MKLINKNIEFCDELKENKVDVYIIENTLFFRKIVVDLFNQVEKNLNGDFMLFEGLEQISLSRNVLIISDFLNLDYNNKKYINHLYKKLIDLVNGLEFQNIKYELENKIYNFLLKLKDYSDYPIDFNDELNYIDLFKAFDVKFEVDSNLYIENIINFIDICYKLNLMKCVIFVNIKNFITKDECYLIYKELMYKKIPVILFENHDRYTLNEYERKIIIDNDLCELYVDFK